MALTPAWTVVVPVRDFSTAKSRLRADLPAGTVSEIARRLALGTVRALERTPRVGRVIIVSDVALGGHFSDAHAHVLVQQVGGGLNGAVHDGLALASARFPSAPRLVIHADLPGINPDDVESLLASAERGGVDLFVPDRAGTGTTALALLPGSVRPVAFGPGSALRHAGLGYTPAELPEGSSLRSDLDTLDELRALRWGVILGGENLQTDLLAA